MDAILHVGLPTGAAGAAALIAPVLTCAGSGCEVTGEEIEPDGLRLGAVHRGPNLPPIVTLVPVAAVYLDVPVGTYIVDLLSSGIGGAITLGGELQVVGAGTSPGAARPTP
jgi:hypothetical protein